MSAFSSAAAVVVRHLFLSPYFCFCLVANQLENLERNDELIAFYSYFSFIQKAVIRYHGE